MSFDFIFSISQIIWGLWFLWQINAMFLLAQIICSFWKFLPVLFIYISVKIFLLSGFTHHIFFPVKVHWICFCGRYYLGLGVSVALLMVLMSLTMGLFCGFCGARPDGGYQDDCCNKGSGARCLMLGVWLMFLSSAVLMAITLAHFMTGITVQKTVCEPLHAPDNSRIFALFDKILNVKDIYPRRPDELTPHLNISTVIRYARSLLKWH